MLSQEFNCVLYLPREVVTRGLADDNGEAGSGPGTVFRFALALVEDITGNERAPDQKSHWLEMIS